MSDVSNEDLVEAIYAGMASPEQLEHALRLAIARVEANGGNFHIVSKSDLKSALFLGRGANYSERNIGDYLGHWRHVNVHRQAMRAMSAKTANAVFLCHEHLGADVLARAPYLNDFYFRMGERWLAGAVAYQDAKYEVSLVFNRGADQAAFGEPERALIGQLLPHVRRAASLALSVAQQTGGHQAFAESLAHANRAAFLIDGARHVVWRSSAAEAMLQTTNVICVRQEHLSLADPNADAGLLHLTKCALNRELAIGAETLRLVEGERVLALEVMPASVPAGGVFGAQALALVLVREMELDSSATGQLQRRFGLTKAEARLAVDLAGGRSIEDVADLRGLRRTTLRAQLREVFAKTGVTRQASLVAMIWRMVA
jgi:DNA-binding CsgD family transcriptional regulator